MLRLMKVGRKRRKPAPNFFPSFSNTSWCNERWIVLFLLFQKNIKERNEDRCAISFKKTHPRDVFKDGK